MSRSAEQIRQQRMRDYLQEMSLSNLTAHRWQVAKHIETPISVLLLLLRDKKHPVVKAVRGNETYIRFEQELSDELGIPRDLPQEWQDKILFDEIESRYPLSDESD